MSVSVPEYDTSPEAIGTRLAKVRKTLGRSQSALAEVLGMSSQRYNNYELGRTQPPPPVLAQIWRLTGATSDYILFGNESGLPFDLVMKLREIDAQEAGKRSA